MADKQMGNPGNFASDREKASEAGKKGGQASHSASPQQSGAGRSGTNFAEDRDRASEAGRKGGQHSHGGH
ncbi:MAG TPA: general stress protein [Aliidongia sp.]|nr:general stress protein [Aliidongia sp.]